MQGQGSFTVSILSDGGQAGVHEITRTLSHYLAKVNIRIWAGEFALVLHPNIRVWQLLASFRPDAYPVPFK